MALYNLSLIGKTGFILFFAGTATFLVAFSIPAWASWDNRYYMTGLWEHCGKHACSKTLWSDPFDNNQDGLPGLLTATQTMMCLAIMSLITSFTLRFLFVCGKPKSYLLVSVIMDTVTVALGLTGAAMFGHLVRGYSDLSFGWAYVLNVVSCGFILAATVLLLVEYMRLP